MTPAEADGLLFDGTTHCAGDLPLAWSAGPAPAGAAERDATVLRLLGQLEEASGEPREDKAAPEADWLRLEAKLDLLLHVVGTLVAQQRPLPQSEPLILSSRGLVWRCAPRALRPGDRGWVALHLHPALPLPLELPATVVATDDAVSPPRAWLAFDALAGPLAAALERYTFRRHRRAVAGLRQARAAAAG
jgi:hypothetical protein